MTHDRPSLDQFLTGWAGSQPVRRDVAAAISAVAQKCLDIRSLVSRGPLDARAGRIARSNGHGEAITAFDEAASEILISGVAGASVAAVSTEHLDEPVAVDRHARLLLAVDPLDGSTNMDTNAAVGTIFSLLPRPTADIDVASAAAFLQPGDNQLAAGFFVYGPRTSLVLTVREGAHVFALDPDRDVFVLTQQNVVIPKTAREYAINASNYRHWDEAIRTYVDDCLNGVEGVRAHDFNMRWIGSLVAEIYRIFSRGGIYLYPADRREGYAQGRLRLIQEANPIGLVVENAGGAASTGETRILGKVPRALHQRTPIVVGSAFEVDYVMRLSRQPHALGERSPLFGRRGLFRV